MPLITQSARAFEMVARSGSIRRAAERINAAPSAVNRQILNLEEELGIVLFERLPRGMRLTKAGELIVAQIREWQAKERKTRTRLDDLKGQRGDYIRIGVMECLASEFVPKAFAELRSTHPNSRLRTVVSGTTEIVRQLKANETDLAVAFNMPGDSGLKVLHEVKMPLGVIMPGNHPLAKRQKIELHELFEHPLVVADDSITIGPVVTAMIERSRVPATPVVTTNSISMLKSLIGQGVGVSIMTPIDVYDELLRGELRFTPVVGARMFEVLTISARDAETLLPSAARMAKLLGAVLEKALDTVKPRKM